MPYRRRLALAILFLVIAACVPQAHAQRRGRSGGRTKRPVPTNPKPTATSGPEEDPYWAAQRDIAAAIQRLEAYLRESPEGERAATARRQLTTLRELTATAATPEWVRMGELSIREVPEWRAASVDQRPNKTRVTVEVACRREDGRDCYFRPFDRSPLVLVDNAGRLYQMLEPGTLPADVRAGDREGQVALSGGRTVTITVDFAPLAAGVLSGQLYYRDRNQAGPARFSLSPRR
ncbi:MAG TPA: hypothetical protein VF570_03995 [Pyrinomonadaceae bacterium]|jgi:hypothetical protein